MAPAALGSGIIGQWLLSAQAEAQDVVNPGTRGVMAQASLSTRD